MNEPNAGPGPEAGKPAAAPAGKGDGAGQKDGAGPDAAAPTSAAQRGSFASSAANDPGGTSKRLDSQRRAQQQLLVGSGSTLADAVMGDKNMYFFSPDGKKVSWRKLSAEEVDKDNAFVDPADYPRIRDFAASRALIVLTGPAGVGKYATALHLLTEETGRRLVHVLRPDTGLAELAAESLPKGTGIILQDIAESAAAKLGGYELRQLIAAVEEADQKLIITVPDTLTWRDPEISKYRVAQSSGADPERVVERQLRFQLGPDRAAELLEHPDVRALITEVTGQDRQLRELAMLAELLAKATGDAAEAAATARAGMADHSETDFVSWFEGLEELEIKCYAIALSVLNGLSNEKVADAGKRLEIHLSPETAEARDASRTNPFSGSTRRKLVRIRAHQGPSEEPVEPGVKQTPVISYLDYRYPSQVLLHVWQEYDEVRAGLIDWLRELGAHGLKEVRTRAGVAVGVLALESYDHVLQTIVYEWAESEDEDQRDAAAVAIQTIGSKPWFADRIGTQLSVWADSESLIELQSSAARAHGSDYGAKKADEALAALGELALVEQWPVSESVMRSLTELMAAGDAGLTRRILDMLTLWVAGRKQYLRLMGRLTFLYAAADLVERRSGEDGPDLRLPTLLRLDEDPGYAPILRALWINTLNSSDLFRTARDVLTAWAKFLEPEPTGRAALARMLTALASTERTAAIVSRLAQEWAGRDGSGVAPRLSFELSTALSAAQSTAHAVPISH